MIPKPTVKPKNTFKNSTSCLLRPDFALEKVRLIRMIATIKKSDDKGCSNHCENNFYNGHDSLLFSFNPLLPICFLLYVRLLSCSAFGAFLLSHSPYKGIAKEKEPEHNREQGKSAYSLGCFNLAESAIHCDGYKHQHINCDTDKIINC